MRKAMMDDGSARYTDTRKHQVGEWYEDYWTKKWHIVTSAVQGEVRGEYGIDKVWLHELREATAEELAVRERKQAEWNALTPEQRTEEQLNSLAAQFPGLDW